MGEFELIRQYFTATSYPTDVLLGVGDDAAVLAVPPGERLVAAVDTIVEGVHFPVGSPAADIAWRALAVNLSDMAAMGATPRWFTLSLCLPQARTAWLTEFATTLDELARQFGVSLVGGDTVRGPLNVSIQILGTVENNRWLTRSGAHVGDVVYVSGMPGEAAGGLQLLLKPAISANAADRQHLIARFTRPSPRVALGRGLRSLANAAMDVSDGLLTDLSKLCAASQVGARLHLDALPMSPSLSSTFGMKEAEHHVLHGGDDYELLFTIAPDRVQELEHCIKSCGVLCTAIGEIVPQGGVQCYRAGQPVTVAGTGFDHFADVPAPNPGGE